ncbi:MAG: GTP cyclohydrolase I FolE2 [Nanoarchaeota archaeon]|nr:GTP cyclohydrolase I FolE2 [Nanoarchaeota archaeon]
MKDIQNSITKHKLKIDTVGVKNLKYPLMVLDKKNKHQKTVADVNVYVNLPASFRGTHMSRFIEVLNKYLKKTLTVEVLDNLIFDLKKALNSEAVHLEISFPYFIKKTSPVSKKSSLLDYSCKIIRVAEDHTAEHFTEVIVPITTLCPCSKEISKVGAHNQRSFVTLRVKLNKFIWIEDLIKLVEKEASCEVYPLLKREDEKFVTEKAYSNPKFVEDVVRGIASKLKKNKRVAWFRVECENHESVHNHNAYACIEKNN